VNLPILGAAFGALDQLIAREAGREIAAIFADC
jgi:hypothetical protein